MTYCGDGVGTDQRELEAEIEHVGELGVGNLAEDVVCGRERHLCQGLLRTMGCRGVGVLAVDVAEESVAEDPDQHQMDRYQRQQVR